MSQPPEDNDQEIYGGYSVDDEDQPGAEDTLAGDDLDDPLDRGYSPPERWSAGQGYGNTPLEEELGETLDQRLAQEEPEPDPYREAEASATALDEADEGRQVGDARTGRLVAPDGGSGEDSEKDEVARDVGIDGAAASAEEAAMHDVATDSFSSVHEQDER